MPQPVVQLTELEARNVARALRRANGTRSERTLSAADVRATLVEASDSPRESITIRHGGTAARGQTTLCLVFHDSHRRLIVAIGACDARDPSPRGCGWPIVTTPRAAAARSVRHWSAGPSDERFGVSLETPVRAPIADDAPLLRAVLQDPDDDAPRLVYADWLTERGDPRGEFIAYEVEAARLPRGRRKADLEACALQLKEAHLEVWHEALEMPAEIPYGYERGFVHRIHATPARFLARAARIFARSPVRALNLTVAKVDVLGEMLASDLVARLAELNIHCHGFLGAGGTARVCAAIEAAPDHLARIRHLRITGAALTERQIERLEGILPGLTASGVR